MPDDQRRPISRERNRVAEALTVGDVVGAEVRVGVLERPSRRRDGEHHHLPEQKCGAAESRLVIGQRSGGLRLGCHTFREGALVGQRGSRESSRCLG